MGYGKKVWIFPDAELPPVGVNLIPGHESVIITNTGDREANIRITLLYTDKEPVSFMTTVQARRVRCLRTNEEKDFAEYKQLLAGKENVSFRLYPGLNHAFVPSVFGDIMKAKQEYAVEQHIGEEVILGIADWIQGH
jgi:hypothetical protein